MRFRALTPYAPVRHRSREALPSPPRKGRPLILATKPFEAEVVWRSWYELLISFVAWAACAAAIVWCPWWLGKIAIAAFNGAVLFRIFSLYHDHLHKSLLPSSKPAQAIFATFGILILVPRKVWKETHNFHHINNGKIEWTTIGSYGVMTTEQFTAATPEERKRYLRARGPWAMLFGFFVVGVYGMCFQAFRRSPKRNWPGPIAIVVHLVILAVLGFVTGWGLALVVWWLPICSMHALSAYLFYVQHNFPGTVFFERGKWDYTAAAIDGSSYLVMGPIMRWLTSNIGYHHVHHLNAKIPSYRLPEAMAAIPELQSPHRTTFAWRDIWAALRLKTWDPEHKRMDAL